jgi:hypothetical protein
VSDLIDPISGDWDIDLLNDLFGVVDVHRILQIPLHIHGFDDFIAWSETKHGRYTVRSGYYLQWHHQFAAPAASLSLPGGSASNPVWKILWRMKIPSKVKIFMWRALHGILPLQSILYNHHIGTTCGCPICNQGPEDISHLLFQCETARDLWNNLGIADLIIEAKQVDRAGSSVLEELLRRQDNTLVGFSEIGLNEMISVSCWYLWWIRRRKTHNEVVPPIYRCKMSILSITANALKASKSAGTREARWSKPKPRHVKLNVDASFFEDRHAGAAGAVLHDFQGNFLAASCVFLPHLTTPLMAEAIEMREGLKLANEMSCTRVQAESDSTEIIDACKGA